MSGDDELLEGMDLAELRRGWNARRDAMRTILRRFDSRGMTRPGRDAAERVWLEERGIRLLAEDERQAGAAREYYARKYRR